MANYAPNIYDEREAAVYDDNWNENPQAAVSVLSDLAGGGRALELGIGTGRVALPLAVRGTVVEGIDASPAMVAKMRAKPAGGEIPVHMGNFADVAVEGSFRLIYVVLNTLTALPSQEEQVRCFRNVAQHLTAGGFFVVDLFMPDLWRFVRSQYTVASVVEVDHVGLDLVRHDPVHQRTMHQHVAITSKGIELFPAELRYVWPAELDLMAQLAGMRRRDRWGGWGREEFTADSGRFISVYQLNREE